MPTKKKMVCAYLEEKEYEKIKELVDASGLSMSSFIKKVCLGQKIKSTVDYQAYLVMMKARADLGRLGGLFKMALSDKKTGSNPSELRPLLRQIERNQNKLMSNCQKIAESFNK